MNKTKDKKLKKEVNRIVRLLWGFKAEDEFDAWLKSRIAISMAEDNLKNENK